MCRVKRSWDLKWEYMGFKMCCRKCDVAFRAVTLVFWFMLWWFGGFSLPPLSQVTSLSAAFRA